MESLLQAFTTGLSGSDGLFSFNFHTFLEAGPDNFIELGFGLTKLGDIVSDIFFVKSFNENLFYIDFDDFGLYICAGVFTSVGILFDLYKFMHFVKQRWYSEQQWCCRCCKGCCCNEGSSEDITQGQCNEGSSGDITQGQKENSSSDWKWWKRSNIVFEEIPQLIIAGVYVYLFAESYFDCVEDCEDAYFAAKNSAIASAGFSIASLSFGVFTYFRHRKNTATKNEEVVLSGTTYSEE
jgi:hypothetical protein